MHWCKNRRPLVTLKAATDINGRIDGNKDVPAERFSNEESLKLVQDLRAESMAILIGVNTAIRDNPSLTVRGRDIGPRDRPVRVVIDPNNRILNDSNLMNDGLAPTLLVQISEFDKTNDKEHVERVVISENKEIDILKILDMLGDRKIQSLLVEGGSNTWMRFLESGFVDKAHLCVSNMELSGESNEIFSKEYLLNSGLTKIRDIKISNDTVSLWKK